ncbi:Centrosome-associated C terminus [Popillia japonica]|uniref:Centrosome-associated C terminus n=1 Tax=Popillia japonica TaxID=7064 RepID=A0AAW1JGS8_POPJA
MPAIQARPADTPLKIGYQRPILPRPARAAPEPVSHLEQFFEHLGLTSDSYEDMLSNSRSSDSPVFFSDVSTVDSSRPIDNVDYCHAQTFRPSEPPSIVERNARIIKWLCNCRKLQLS